jgi:hypothetical protein
MSNAGPGLAPNKQSATGKVSAINQHGDKVALNSRTSGQDNSLVHGVLPQGSLLTKDTGMPQNNGSRPGNGLKIFNTKAPKNANRPLGTSGRLTGK